MCSSACPDGYRLTVNPIRGPARRLSYTDPGSVPRRDCLKGVGEPSREAGFAAYKKAGSDPNTLIANPHSVGLQHTDQPYRDDTPFRVGEDIILKPGMTITVDLPYIEMGFGAGHNEDLILITETGHELLHETEAPLLII